VLSRLDRYLLREVVLTFVAVTGVLLVILVSNQFARVLGQAARPDCRQHRRHAHRAHDLAAAHGTVPIGLFLGIVLRSAASITRAR